MATPVTCSRLDVRLYALPGAGDVGQRSLELTARAALTMPGHRRRQRPVKDRIAAPTPEIAAHLFLSARPAGPGSGNATAP